MRRLLIRKLQPNQMPLLSTRWALVSYETTQRVEPSLKIEGYYLSHAEAITAADELLREG